MLCNYLEIRFRADSIPSAFTIFASTYLLHGFGTVGRLVRMVYSPASTMTSEREAGGGGKLETGSGHHDFVLARAFKLSFSSHTSRGRGWACTRRRARLRPRGFRVFCIPVVGALDSLFEAGRGLKPIPIWQAHHAHSDWVFHSSVPHFQNSREGIKCWVAGRSSGLTP